MDSRRRFVQSTTAAGLLGAWWPARTAVAQPCARTLRVGRSPGAIPTIADAARLARDGDTVEIEAGLYRGDVAIWPQRRLTIRARGGPVRLVADEQAADGKAIWVLSNGEFDVEGIEFTGCRVPHRNGAGIRFERGHLRLKWCRFFGNQMGLLTSNDPAAVLEAVSCEFSDNSANDGFSHNLYVGSIARAEISGCYFARAHVGHLLKSRARENRILYNRLTDETGTASYEIDLPNGGRALVLGNLIVQEASTQNWSIVSFGAEGYKGAQHELAVVHNTLVNRRPGDAMFVRVLPGQATVRVVNNLLVGAGRLDGVLESSPSDNLRVPESVFRAPRQYDFALPEGSNLRERAVMPESSPQWPMRPTAQYEHPMRLRPLTGRSRPSHGAIQEG